MYRCRSESLMLWVVCFVINECVVWVYFSILNCHCSKICSFYESPIKRISDFLPFWMCLYLTLNKLVSNLIENLIIKRQLIQEKITPASFCDACAAAWNRVKILVTTSLLKFIKTVLVNRWNLYQVRVMAGSFIITSIFFFFFIWILNLGLLRCSPYQSQYRQSHKLHDTTATSLNNNSVKPYGY